MSGAEPDLSAALPIATVGVSDGAFSTLIAAPGAGRRLLIFAILVHGTVPYSLEDTAGTPVIAGALAPLPADTRLEMPAGPSPWAELPDNVGLRVSNRQGFEGDGFFSGGVVFQTLGA